MFLKNLSKTIIICLVFPMFFYFVMGDDVSALYRIGLGVVVALIFIFKFKDDHIYVRKTLSELNAIYTLVGHLKRASRTIKSEEIAFQVSLLKLEKIEGSEKLSRDIQNIYLPTLYLKEADRAIAIDQLVQRHGDYQWFRDFLIRYSGYMNDQSNEKLKLKSIKQAQEQGLEEIKFISEQYRACRARRTFFCAMGWLPLGMLGYLFSVMGMFEDPKTVVLYTLFVVVVVTAFGYISKEYKKNDLFEGVI